MINTEVFIEGYRLDITKDVDYMLTFALDDIKDFSSRNTSFSKTIILPGTTKNNKLFGHIFDVEVSNYYDGAASNVGVNYNAAKGARCLIFKDHIQIFKGVLRLLEVVLTPTDIEYEISIFGELGGLILKMGNKKISDLDFSEHNHLYNTGNILSSWDNSSGAGYYYPLIDVGAVSTNKIDYDFRSFRPALFIKEYIEKIFLAAGYTFTSNLISSPRFKKLIIPYNRKSLTANASKILDVTRDDIYTVLFNAPDSTRIPFSSFVGTLFSGGGTIFTYIGADPVNTTLVLNLAFEWKTNGTTISIEIKKNSVTFATKVLSNTGGTLVTSGTWIENIPLSLVLNDYLEIWVTVADSSKVPYLFNIKPGGFVLNTSTPVPVPIALGDIVNLNDTIPLNIYQNEFLSSIIKLFNLYVYEKTNDLKKLYIEPYVDFFTVSGSVDWTHKLDRSRDVRLKPMSELNYKIYNFKYRDDTDYYNDLYKKRYSETYGSRIFDSNYEFTNEIITIELLFSPTPLVGYVGKDKIVSTIFKLTNSVEEKIDFNIRILQTKKITSVAAWDIEDGGVDLVSDLDYYGYAGHYDDPDVIANDLNFGVLKELFYTDQTGAIEVNQFNIYWSPYMAEITDKDSKLLTGYFKLTVSDIESLDFAKYIYLNGSYWRLNKIIDFNAANPGVCVCELLKVIYKTY